MYKVLLVLCCCTTVFAHEPTPIHLWPQPDPISNLDPITTNRCWITKYKPGELQKVCSEWVYGPWYLCGNEWHRKATRQCYWEQTPGRVVKVLMPCPTGVVIGNEPIEHKRKKKK